MKKDRIIREVDTSLDMERVVSALRSVLGSDRVHAGLNSELGHPRAFVPSGVPDLDLVLDRAGRGWPAGRIVEIYGGEATCKTGLGYALIAQAQRIGGGAILYPSEGNWDEWLAEQYGVNLDKLVLGDDETVEGISDSWNKALDVAGTDGLLVGMIDSVAALSTKAELGEENLTRGRQAQIRAMMMSAALRKIGARMPRSSAILFCVNQVRDNTDTTGYGDQKPKPPGGRALKFYASVRLRLENIARVTYERAGKRYVAGFKLRIIAEKNRLAMPFSQAEIMLSYEKGLLPLKRPKKGKKGK